MVGRIAVIFTLVCTIALFSSDDGRIHKIYLPAIYHNMEHRELVFSNQSVLLDNQGRLHIWGEVQNRTGNHIESVLISASVFNARDELIGSDYGRTYLNTIAAQSAGCAHLIIPNAIDWFSYELDSISVTIADTQPITIEIGSSGEYRDNQYIINGHTPDSVPRYTGISATLYNEQGNVCGCNFGNIDRNGDFSILFHGSHYSATIDYQLQSGIHTAW